MPNNSYHHSMLQLITTLWVLVCGAAILAYSLANPIAEWDMLAYAASVEEMKGATPEDIHNKVYSELKARTTTAEYEALTNSNNYRVVMHNDVGAFNEQIPYYSIRVTFSALLANIHNLGVSVFDAGYWVTATAFVLSLLVLWGALNDRIHPVFQLLLPLMFYKYTKDLEVVRQILADSLSALWVVFICIAYLRGTRLILPLLALSVFVRVDLAIFSGLVLLVLFATSERKRYFELVACGVALVAAFLFVQEWAGSYGWKTLYYFAIISDMLATHPSEYGQIGFTVNEYIQSLFDPTRWISRMFWVTAALSFVIIVIWISARLDNFNKKVCRISIVCMLYIALHYLIFPHLYLRFFVGQNMMIFAGVSLLLSHFWYEYARTRLANNRPMERS